jgi:hypothetical protein
MFYTLFGGVPEEGCRNASLPFTNDHTFFHLGNSAFLLHRISLISDQKWIAVKNEPKMQLARAIDSTVELTAEELPLSVGCEIKHC